MGKGGVQRAEGELPCRRRGTGRVVPHDAERIAVPECQERPFPRPWKGVEPFPRVLGHSKGADARAPL
jgi:hypothetical protein